MPLMRTRLLPTARSALSFNGVNQYVVIQHSDSLYLSGDFTVMFWASLETPYNVWAGVVDKGRRLISDFWFLTTDEPYRVLFGIGFTDNTFTEMRFPLVNQHELHMYCGGVEGSSMFISMDEGSKVYRSFTKERRIGTQPIAIGCRSVALEFSAVRIAQLLIYRRALSDEEIQWNFYYPDNPIRNGLVLWLHWDSIGVERGIWYDKSGFGNHATLYNNPAIENVAKAPLRLLTSTRILTPVR
ncbi:MAG: hypothetical protein QXU08_08980 [Ignisphaera sp.]